MGRTRTFVAVDIGDDIRNNAIDLQEMLAKTGAKVKWVARRVCTSRSLFLGEVDDRKLHPVCRAVKDVAASEPPFPLRVSGVGAFPTSRHPKIAWAGIVEGVELGRLHEALENRLLEMGCYRKEEREYTPHLTLGRVNGEADGHKLAPELAKAYFLGRRPHGGE